MLHREDVSFEAEMRCLIVVCMTAGKIRDKCLGCVLENHCGLWIVRENSVREEWLCERK
jgi:hypothetical protein